ncbi:hypothetical protein ACFE04_028993 [Oxalis oulophora]
MRNNWYDFIQNRRQHTVSSLKKRSKGGGKDLPLGWDASLRANTRRSTHASSVWLRNSSGGSFSDSPSSIFIDRSELSGSSVPLGPHNITSIGISTSGLPPISDSVLYAVHMNDLDVIAEDAPIDLVEGKKRLRSTNVLVTDVSNLKDSQVANMVAPGVGVSSYSDHDPLVISVDVAFIGWRCKRFRFENSWLLEPGIVPIIRSSWLQLGWADVLTKLTVCKEDLQVWCRQCRGNYGQIVKELENRTRTYEVETKIEIFLAQEWRL